MNGTSSDQSIVFVQRPDAAPKPLCFSQKLALTLADGNALLIPINGDSYAVVRNRFAGNGGQVAKRLGACLRTLKSDDGHGLLIWLEPKKV